MFTVDKIISHLNTYNAADRKGARVPIGLPIIATFTTIMS